MQAFKKPSWASFDTKNNTKYDKNTQTKSIRQLLTAVL